MDSVILNVPKFLIVAATRHEIQPLLSQFNVPVHSDEGAFISEDTSHDLTVIISGVGMVNTAYYLGRYSHNMFDYVINLGICGSFNHDIKIGEVVNVVSDIISELGAEDGDDFIKYEDLKLGGTNQYSNLIQFDYAPLNALKKVKGITVNKVHGNNTSIEKIQNLFSPDVESMEGAGFFRGCNRLSENYFQIRSVSNYVEKRDKSKWNIPSAIKNLNDFAIQLINDLNK